MFKKSKIEMNGFTITQEEILEMSNYPENFKDEVFIANGDLDFTGCTKLKALPKILGVDGNLIIDGCTNLTALPECLIVKGSVSITGCNNIVTLPTKIVVFENLFVTQCPALSHLSDDMMVSQILNI